MANILIKTINKCIDKYGKEFTTIYGAYTIDADKNYILGSYEIPLNNIASKYTGEVTTSKLPNGTIIV